MITGISGATFGADHPLDADILLAARNGFARLDIDQAKLDRYLAQPDFDIRDLTRLFLRTQPGALDGLELPCTASDLPALRARADALCQRARRVGCPLLIVRPAPGVAPTTAVMETLRTVAEVARRWSLRLAIAPQPEGPTLLADLHAAQQTLTEIGDEALGLLLDTVTLHATGRDARTIAALPGSLIAHVHVADSLPGQWQRLLPGTGSLPLAADLRALAATDSEAIVALALAPTEPPDDPAALAAAAHTALTALLAAADSPSANEQA